MLDHEIISYAQSVQRKIPGNIRVLQVLLDIAVVIFAIIGTMGSLYWSVLAVVTLVFSWYMVGQARVTYIYQLEGYRMTVKRVSGFKSHPKTEEFAELDLSKLRIMAPEDSEYLNEAENETKDLKPKRITYDVSAHDPDLICSVMFLEGIERESGRWLKVYFQPSPVMKENIMRLCPGRVQGYEDEIG